LIWYLNTPKRIWFDSRGKTILCLLIEWIMNSNNRSEPLDSQLFINQTNNSSLVALQIEFELIEIYVIVIHFVLALIVNIALGLSVILSSKNSQAMRRVHRMPVVDFILLIMSVNTIARLLTKSGLQILCLCGKCQTIKLSSHIKLRLIFPLNIVFFYF